MKNKIAESLAPLLKKVRTDARGVKKQGGKPYKQDKDLDVEALQHHANGGPAYGAYPIKPGESVTLTAVLDFDSHKGESTWAEMVVAAMSVTDKLAARGITVHPWRSGGGRGIHLLMTWANPQDARSVRALLRDVLAECGFRDGTDGVKAGEVEIFPKQDRIAIGAYGNYYFLPAAFESVPLDPLDFDPLTKAAIVGYIWHDSPDVPLAPIVESPNYTSQADAAFDDVASAVCAIPNSGDKSLDYDQWRNVLFGIHAADPGEDGRCIAEVWSEQSEKHDRRQFDHVWRNIKSRPDGVGVATVFRLARLAGWRLYSDDQLDALDTIAPGDDSAAKAAEQAMAAMKSPATATAAPDIYVRNRFGEILATIENCRTALASVSPPAGARFGFDSFRDEIMVRERGSWRPVTDVDLIRIRITLGRAGWKPVGRELMRDAVLEVADDHKFDSAIKWLAGLKWDGVSRVSGFLKNYFGVADSPYATAVSEYLWTALAGRVLVPGIQCDMVPILIGPQGAGKSTGVALLSPAPEMYAEISLDEKDDDLARKLRGCLVAELGELKGLSGREVEHTKAFITRRHEKWVPKYREFTTQYPRRCVIVGTTNQGEFLDDPTGARRWLPVEVGTINRITLAADVLQLWAEGAAMFECDRDLGGDGVIWESAERLAQEVHDGHTVDDVWAEDVARWIDERETCPPFSVVEALKGSLLVPGGTLNQGHKKRMASILRRLGYRDIRVYVEGRQTRVWEPKPTEVTK